MEHIGGGATHVETNDRLRRQPSGSKGPPAHCHGAHHASGRPREDRVFGQQQLRRCQSPTGSHHPQPGCWPQGQLHLAQVAAQHRRHRRLHQGGLAAGHQPGLATEPMGEHHGLEAQGCEPLLQLQLLAGIAGAVQQGHRATAVAVGLGLQQQLLQILSPLERCKLESLRIQAPLHLQHPHPQGVGPLNGQGKEVGAVQVADAEQVGKAAVDQQHHPGAALLQQGVGGHGGAQPHLPHQSQRQGAAGHNAGLLAQQRSYGTHGRVPRALRLHRQHLAHQQLASWAAAHHVCEGATPINPEAPARGGTDRLHRLSGSSQTAKALPRPGP